MRDELSYVLNLICFSWEYAAVVTFCLWFDKKMHNINAHSIPSHPVHGMFGARDQGLMSTMHGGDIYIERSVHMQQKHLQCNSFK